MKIFNYCIVVLFGLCLFLVSCEDKEFEEILSIVEELIETDPDSCLVLLDSIYYPELMKEKSYANYLLYRAQVTDKLSLSLGENILLQHAVDYFIKVNDNEKAALSLFYLSREFQHQSDDDNAIKNLLLAEEYALKTQNYDLLGLIYCDIGTIHHGQLRIFTALENYQKAEDYFIKADNEKNAMYIHQYIGNAYLFKINSQPDDIKKAMESYNKAIDYAIQNEDYITHSRILYNIGQNYFLLNDFPTAKEYMLKAKDLPGAQNQLVLPMLAEIYTNLGKPDSALYFMDCAVEVVDTTQILNLQSINYTYAGIYREMKDYEMALFYQEKFTQNLLDNFMHNENKSYIKYQSFYNDERIKNKINMIQIQRQYLIILSCITCIVILISVMLVTFYQRKKKDYVREAEQKMEIKDRLLAIHKGKDEELKKTLLEKLNIAKKIVQIKVNDSSSEKEFIQQYNEIFGQDLNDTIAWENIYGIINRVYENFVEKLNSKFSNLKEREIKICCLLVAGFNTEEVKFILSYTDKSFQVIKSNLLRTMNFKRIENLITYLYALGDSQ